MYQKIASISVFGFFLFIFTVTFFLSKEILSQEEEVSVGHESHIIDTRGDVSRNDLEMRNDLSSDDVTEKVFLFETLHDITFSAKIKMIDNQNISGAKIEFLDADSGQMFVQGVSDARGEFGPMKVSIPVATENIKIIVFRSGFKKFEKIILPKKEILVSVSLELAD